MERNGEIWRELGRSEMMGGGDWRDRRGLEWTGRDWKGLKRSGSDWGGAGGAWKGLEGKVTGERGGGERNGGKKARGEETGGDSNGGDRKGSQIIIWSRLASAIALSRLAGARRPRGVVLPGTGDWRRASAMGLSTLAGARRPWGAPLNRHKPRGTRHDTRYTRRHMKQKRHTRQTRHA